MGACWHDSDNMLGIFWCFFFFSLLLNWKGGAALKNNSWPSQGWVQGVLSFTCNLKSYAEEALGKKRETVVKS